MINADNNEKIIKSRIRVKQHGEVFTPRNIVRNMINLPGMKNLIKEFETTILEPSCGEGVFIVEILKKRLKKVREECKDDLIVYENLALLSITTLYGIELLEDNAQKCVINIFEILNNDYMEIAQKLNRTVETKVLDSAKVIISANIVQGNFLTKMTTSDKPIVFSEWQVKKTKRKTKYINIERTEFSLEEIIKNDAHEAGNVYIKKTKSVQLSILDMIKISGDTDEDEKEEIRYRYIPVKIIDLYKEEMEEIYG